MLDVLEDPQWALQRKVKEIVRSALRPRRLRKPDDTVLVAAEQEVRRSKKRSNELSPRNAPRKVEDICWPIAWHCHGLIGFIYASPYAGFEGIAVKARLLADSDLGPGADSTVTLGEAHALEHLCDFIDRELGQRQS